MRGLITSRVCTKKTYAINRPNRTALLISPIIYYLNKILFIFVFVINLIVRLIFRKNDNDIKNKDLQSEEELKGVITDGDIRRALIDNENFAELKAKDLMNTNPLTALESDNLQVAEKRMREAKVQCLIVKNLMNEVVGVIQIFE